jgi:uncharacterized protein YndB with AHSA1/START domain
VGSFRLQFTFGEGDTATGIFTEISPPERIAFSFGWEGSDTFPPGTSLVEIELRPQADGTVLKLKHRGFPDATRPKFTPKNMPTNGPVTCPGWPRPSASKPGWAPGLGFGRCRTRRCRR